ncbi:MAG: hypothetical protein GY708_23970 [Actinomycetia bacterium]|nr:hypothetical protein [Actinomycetes bacterium]MCP4962418.1 hypothetical protein [Actinomycetes bacterium]
MIRTAVREFLAERGVEAKERRYIDGYRHEPQSGSDEREEVEASEAATALEVARRLDDEEAARGLSW